METCLQAPFNAQDLIPQLLYPIWCINVIDFEYEKNVYILLGLSFLIIGVAKLDFSKAPSLCAFCDDRIIEKQLFYRKNGVLGLITHKPAAQGHVLIIPERHVERFEDLTSEELIAIGDAIKKIDRAVRAAFRNQDYLLLQKNGKKAGQSVPHLHFHYLPAVKYLAARFLISPWLKPLKEEEIKLLRKSLYESLSEPVSTASNLL